MMQRFAEPDICETVLGMLYSGAVFGCCFQGVKY
jgi:hypothetical protein